MLFVLEARLCFSVKHLNAVTMNWIRFLVSGDFGQYPPSQGEILWQSLPNQAESPGSWYFPQPQRTWLWSPVLGTNPRRHEGNLVGGIKHRTMIWWVNFQVCKKKKEHQNCARFPYRCDYENICSISTIIISCWVSDVIMMGQRESGAWAEEELRVQPGLITSGSSVCLQGFHSVASWPRSTC